MCEAFLNDDIPRRAPCPFPQAFPFNFKGENPRFPAHRHFVIGCFASENPSIGLNRNAVNKHPMKTLLKVFTAIAALTFATAAFAAEETVSLGSKDYYSTITIELREYGYGSGGSVVLYCDNVLVFAADPGGVTYAAAGVSYWIDSYGFFHVTQLPEGEYTGGLSVNWGGSFSSSGNNVTWQANSGQYWMVADFY